MQLQPLFFSPDDSYSGPQKNQFIESIQATEEEVETIAGKLEKFSAFLFSYSAPSEEIQDKHKEWNKNLIALREQFVRYKNITDQLYQQLPFLESSSCIPDAMRKIQCLNQKVGFIETRIINLISASQSPMYSEAVTIYKVTTKSYEEFLTQTKNPQARLKKLDTLFTDSFEKIKDQNKNSKNLENKFLASRINNLHVEFFDFFKQTCKNINSTISADSKTEIDLLSEKISKIHLSENTTESEEPEQQIPETSDGDTIITYQTFEIIEPKSQEPQLDLLIIGNEMNLLITRFDATELSKEFCFKTSDGLISYFNLISHSNISSIIIELEGIAKIFQGLQNQIKQRITFICEGNLTPYQSCTSLAQENELYKIIINSQYEKLRNARNSLYNKDLEGGVRNGLYYAARLFVSLHDTKEIHRFFEELIDEKNQMIFLTEKMVFKYIAEADYSSQSRKLITIQNLYSAAHAIENILDEPCQNTCISKFRKQIISSLTETISVISKKTLEIPTDSELFWKIFSEKRNLSTIRARGEPENALPESLKIYLSKEMTSQLYFSKEYSLELDLVIFSLNYDKKYKELLASSLTKETEFNKIYENYTPRISDNNNYEKKLKLFYDILMIFIQCNTRDIASFGNYTRYLRNCVLIEAIRNKASKTERNPKIRMREEKFLAKADLERSNTVAKNKFPIFTQLNISSLSSISFDSNSVDQEKLSQQLQTLLSNVFWGNKQKKAIAREKLENFFTMFNKNSLCPSLTRHLNLLLAIFVFSRQLELEKSTFMSDFEADLFNQICQGYITTPTISIALRDFFGIPACERLLHRSLTNDRTKLIQQYRGESNFKDWANIISVYSQLKKPSQVKNLNIEIEKIELGYKTEISSILKAIQGEK